MGNLQIKSEAEAFRECLEFHIVSVPNIVAWADGVIGREENPEYPLIEISLSIHMNDGFVSRILMDISGEADPVVVQRLIFAHMRSLFLHDRDADTRIVQAIYKMALDKRFPDEVAKNEMFWFEDALYLAKARIYGDVEDVHDRLLIFLDKYSIEDLN